MTCLGVFGYCVASAFPALFAKVVAEQGTLCGMRSPGWLCGSGSRRVGTLETGQQQRAGLWLHGPASAGSKLRDGSQFG